MEESGISPAEAARLLGVSEEEARGLAGSDGRVPSGAIRDRVDVASLSLELALELARAREEVGRLSGELGEVRRTNLRLQKEAREGAEERRRLTEELLELRAVAEERLMLMERVERIAGVERDLVEAEEELARLKGRSLISRLLDR